MPVTKTSAQRFLRGLLFLGCFAAAILLAGVAALYFLVTPERVSARITEVVERELGLELSMSTLPSVRHLPELVVTIPESTLSPGTTTGSFPSRARRSPSIPWLFSLSLPRSANCAS